MSNDYKEGDNKFAGTIKKVTIKLKPDNLTAKDKEEVSRQEEENQISED